MIFICYLYLINFFRFLIYLINSFILMCTIYIVAMLHSSFVKNSLWSLIIMRSCTNKLILLTFYTITLILVTESRRTIPLKKEKQELEKLLNHINKPAIKSFQVNWAFFLNFLRWTIKFMLFFYKHGLWYKYLLL